MRHILVAMAVSLALGACGERAQTAPSARKPDAKAWDAAQNPFVVPGWKSGDKASWESQIRNRAAGQNEYSNTMPRQ